MVLAHGSGPDSKWGAAEGAPTEEQLREAIRRLVDRDEIDGVLLMQEMIEQIAGPFREAGFNLADPMWVKFASLVVHHIETVSTKLRSGVDPKDTGFFHMRRAARPFLLDALDQTINDLTIAQRFLEAHPELA